MTEKVKTRDDVQRIFDAKQRIASLASQWFAAIHLNDSLAAMRARREINQIKHEIQANYDIIL